MRTLEGRIILVTGGGSGIGRAASLLFAEQGARIAVAGRRRAEGERTAAAIRESGGDAVFLQADIGHAPDVEGLIRDTVSHYGRLDCAFNNAGTEGRKVSLTDLALEEWEEVIRTNLTGTFLLLKYEIAQMLSQGEGAIVNMASVCGFVVRPERCGYNASRHGVIGLTKSAALEYGARGIRVNAIAPGATRTDLFQRSTQGRPEVAEAYARAHPIGRVAEPREIAQAAAWLCSSDASFVLGHTLVTDGGFTLQ